jgi:hypothetical protein
MTTSMEKLYDGIPERLIVDALASKLHGVNLDTPDKAYAAMLLTGIAPSVIGKLWDAAVARAKQANATETEPKPPR